MGHATPMTRTRLRQTWDRLQTSYWFAPLVMGLLALGLAQVVLRLDAAIPDAALSLAPFVYTGSAAEARGALLALAGTILATAGVVSSLLTLPLSVAAAQFGSRLLRLYLRDRTIQVVLGLFVATFVTCLTVALSIPAAALNPDTPQLAASTAMYLSLATLASLVVLIHHIATALQAPNLVAAASAELQGVVRAPAGPPGAAPRRRARPGGAGGAGGADAAAESRDEALAALAAGAGQRVDAAGLGYVQAIDPEAILALAVAHDLVVRVVRKPGHFVRPGDLLALAWPPQRAAGAAVGGLRGCYGLGNLRTPTQDVGYAVNQLVEVALRAMSPALNDPFTAMTCLDHLGAGLALYAEQGEPPRTCATRRAGRAWSSTGSPSASCSTPRSTCCGGPAATTRTCCCGWWTRWRRSPTGRRRRSSARSWRGTCAWSRPRAWRARASPGTGSASAGAALTCSRAWTASRGAWTRRDTALRGRAPAGRAVRSGTHGGPRPGRARMRAATVSPSASRPSREKRPSGKAAHEFGQALLVPRVVARRAGEGVPDAVGRRELVDRLEAPAAVHLVVGPPDHGPGRQVGAAARYRPLRVGAAHKSAPRARPRVSGRPSCPGSAPSPRA